MTKEQQTIIKALTDGDTFFIGVVRFILCLAFVLTMIWLTPLDVFGDDDVPSDEQAAADLDPPSVVPGGVTIDSYTDNNGMLHQCTQICVPVGGKRGRTQTCHTVCL